MVESRADVAPGVGNPINVDSWKMPCDTGGGLLNWSRALRHRNKERVILIPRETRNAVTRAVAKAVGSASLSGEQVGSKL